MPDTPAAQALIETFGRIVVINLPDRADRRRGIDAELRKAGLSLDHTAVELFTAVRPDTAAGFPSIGAHGAFRSHRGVMARLLDQGWSRALVLEDDMAFAPGAIARLPALAAALAVRDWDMLYGHPGDRPDALPPAEAGLVPLPADLGLIQLHFLGLTRRAAEIAVPALDAMAARPPGSADGGPMHVDGALNWVRQSNPALRALAVQPALALQRSSRSDIAAPRWFDRTPGLRQLATMLRGLR
ncbi:MAG: glycosyltransferase family 25 protein [Rhodobacteraceae bacterium]|nr:glycosyltransferase family 25 protein [Paracoccaceae bacterium]